MHELDLEIEHRCARLIIQYKLHIIYENKIIFVLRRPGGMQPALQSIYLKKSGKNYFQALFFLTIFGFPFQYPRQDNN